MQEIIPPGETLSDRDRLKALDALATLMDSQFLIPGTNIRIGLDSIIGLLPVIGDTISVLISSYIVKEAKSLGLPRHVIARMNANIFVDWLIGLVPIAGDAFDVGWKANKKNVELIRKHVSKGRF